MDNNVDVAASPARTTPKEAGTGEGARELNESVGVLRSSVRILGQDTDDLHKKTFTTEWHERTREWAKRSVQELLEEVADLGFAWRDIARMMDVTVPAIRKWRQGERATGENRHRLAGLVASCHQVMDDYCVNEVASWFETPVLYQVPVTPIDLWAGQQPDLVLEHASGHSDPESILTAFDPEWREHYRSNDVDVVTGTDGHRSLRVKG